MARSSLYGNYRQAAASVRFYYDPIVLLMEKYDTFFDFINWYLSLWRRGK